MGIDITVDLRNQFGQTRNQGARPTCMAFAASDTHSFARGTTEYLSTEYAHYSAIRRRQPLTPHRGVPMKTMIDAIREDGQPPEMVWPYLATIPSPLSAWVPPTPCEPIFKHPILQKSSDVSTIVYALNAGQPALLAVRITEQFYQPAVDLIIRARTGDRDTGNHAMVAVGHGTSEADALILVRNSWGDDWADCGYAWVSSDYLKNRLLGVALPFNC